MWKHGITLIAVVTLITPAWAGYNTANLGGNALSGNDYYQGGSEADGSFGAAMGAGATFQPPLSAPQVVPGAGVYSHVTLSCSDVSLSTYIQAELSARVIEEWFRGQIKAMMASIVAEELQTIMYASPTLFSAINMLNQSFQKQFAVFQQRCDAEQAKFNGMGDGAAQSATAQKECYDHEMQTLHNPINAYNACLGNGAYQVDVNNKSSVTQDNATFLSQDTNMYDNANGDTKRYDKALLSAIPEVTVAAVNGTAGPVYKQATISVTQMNANATGWIRNALRDFVAGTVPTGGIPDCNGSELTKAPQSTDACLPSTAKKIVLAPDFLTVRNLPPASASHYVDAMATQIASVDIGDRLVSLRTRLNQAAIKADPSANVTADTVKLRKLEIANSLNTLEAQTKAMQDVQDQQALMTRMQLMASERARQAISKTANTPGNNPPPTSGFASFMNAIGGL